MTPDDTGRVALVALTSGGLELARRIAAALGDAEVHGLTGRADGADVAFADAATHLRDVFLAGRPIIGVCAAGILIRILAPVLGDKQGDAPVIAVAEDGSAAVPLLGGHRGANALAREIAAATGGQAAVTTAGDLHFGVALDDPPAGWRIANPPAVKSLGAALLAGAPVALKVDAGDAGWLIESALAFDDAADMAIRVTDRRDAGRNGELVLRPPVLALGVGCARDTDAEELIALATATLDDAGLAADAVACVASIDLKADEPAVHALADRLGVPARFFPAAELEQEAGRLATPSDIVFRETGCHGVAEGAALAVAGRDGALVVPKHKSRRATCAVARATGTIDPARVGRPRGRLTVVGIGPGAADWRTHEVDAALARATDIVGYGFYLDLLGRAIDGKTRHTSDLGHEEDRARQALELAAAGRTVALVSSGDAGIYALATLVFELLDREDRADWNRVAIVVAPGVSALQAAAARVGAPIGHDFCAISLSDLMTPWADIERRLRAAADGDFVLALYNPASGRRRTQLAAALDILLAARGGGTPVVVARNLGRETEDVALTTLGELDPDRVDMLTILLIGSRSSRTTARGTRTWLYTPRGYLTDDAGGRDRR